MFGWVQGGRIADAFDASVSSVARIFRITRRRRGEETAEELGGGEKPEKGRTSRTFEA